MKLVCIEGENKDHVWQLTGKRLVIGRDPQCDIVIEDPMLSRVHAEVIYDGGSFLFKDNESLNGSYINTVRVNSQVLLPGDVIKLGDTTLKAVEEDLSQEVCWQENDPFVTGAISLDHLTKQVKEAASWVKREKGRRREKDEERGLNAPKLIKNLETIYEVGKTFNSIRNVDEMLEEVGKTLLEVFPDAERLCILLKGKNGTSRFEPKIIKTRHEGHPGPFQLSRTILQKTVKDEMCILAADASNDERFTPSQSTMALQLR